MNPKDFLGKIFISYSSKDKKFVRRLANAIEKEGYKVWLDEKEIIAGDYLPKKIGKAIKSSKVIIVVLSKNSIFSKWVQYEIISSYGDKKPLSERWWNEFTEVISEFGISYFLLITQRPVEFNVVQSVEYKKGKIMLRETPSPFLDIDVVKVTIVDLSRISNTEEYLFLLNKTREFIESFIK